MTAVATKKRVKAQTSIAAESARHIAGHLSAAISISEGAFHNWPLRDQLDRAVCILGRVSDPDTFEPLSGTPDGDLSAMLQAAKEALDQEISAIARDAHMSLCGALHDGILARHVRDVLIELIDAYDGGADGIEKLRQLATYDGAMGGMTTFVGDRAPVTLDITTLSGHEASAPGKEDLVLLGHIENVRIVLDALACDASRNAPWGLLTLVELAIENVNKAMQSRDKSIAEEASVLLAQVTDLATAVLACDHDNTMLMLLPALSLLELARAPMDEWIMAMPRKQA
ncbi:MAG: hypothetical protein I8H71_00770 [Xanthomonadaceae bacterium]|nr:hypothetical protein [Xanthomonadaceae bacterium]